MDDAMAFPRSVVYSGKDIVQTAEPTLSVRLLQPFGRALQRHGRDVEALLSRHGIAMNQLNELDARVPHSTALNLLHDAITYTGDAALSLHAAELIRPGDFDALEYAVRATHTLREAIERCRRYLRLLHDVASFPLTIEGDTARWSFCLLGGAVQSREADEYIVATLIQAGRLFTGLALRPDEVHFTAPPPPCSTEHRRILADTILWNQPQTAMLFRAQALDLAIAAPNPRLSAALVEHAENLLAELSSTGRLTRRVREHIAAELPSGGATLEQTAASLKMSARTLRRHLSAEGTSFSALLDQARRELATDYLEHTDRTITEIAFLLGFGSLSAFSKAFHRWTGQAPFEHRRRTSSCRPKPGGARG